MLDNMLEFCVIILIFDRYTLVEHVVNKDWYDEYLKLHCCVGYNMVSLFSLNTLYLLLLYLCV